MPKFIYDQLGNPVGYINKKFIHTLKGQAIGQLNGNDVHKMDGDYVGELHNGMVVDTSKPDPGKIGRRGDPGNAGYYGIPKNRGAVETEYAVVFYKLLDNAIYVDEAINSYKQKFI